MPTSPTNIGSAPADPFAQVHSFTERILAMYSRGLLNQQDTQERLKLLSLSTDDGRQWIVGARSKRWYSRTEGDWVADSPPEADGSSLTTARAAFAALAHLDAPELEADLRKTEPEVDESGNTAGMQEEQLDDPGALGDTAPTGRRGPTDTPDLATHHPETETVVPDSGVTEAEAEAAVLGVSMTARGSTAAPVDERPLTDVVPAPEGKPVPRPTGNPGGGSKEGATVNQGELQRMLDALGAQQS